MIIDTTYLLPLAGISVETDVLRAIAEGRTRVKLRFTDLKISMISLFELQAKASKIGIPPERVVKAEETIPKVFRVVPFYSSDVVRKAHELNKLLDDYIDAIVVATAVTLGEDLLTEDREIIRQKATVERKYGIRVLSYKDLVTC